MYLSRLLLNPKSRQVISELKSLYEMHRTLSKAFIFSGEEAERRVLFRVEPEMDSSVIVLVQSQTKPDWSRLTVKDNYFRNGNSISIEVKEYKPMTGKDSRFSFRLLANPVKRDAATRKRTALISDEALAEWLKRKGIAGGFETETFATVKGALVSTKMTTGAELRTGQFGSVLFEGVLRVTDSNIFSKTLENGVGSAKGFGFGLLSIKKIGEM